MTVKVAKTIRIILLVIAFFACIVGVEISQKAAKEAAIDVSKINIQITGKNSYHKDNVGTYMYGCNYVDFTYNITNNTKVDWAYLEITTFVYDKNGESLGTIISEFGQSDGSSEFNVKVGETVTKDYSFEEDADNPSDFFMKLYEYDFSEFEFKTEVTNGAYYK